jgi:hypothetical protein
LEIGIRGNLKRNLRIKESENLRIKIVGKLTIYQPVITIRKKRLENKIRQQQTFQIKEKRKGKQ